MSSPTLGSMNEQHIWGGYDFLLPRPNSNPGPNRGAPGGPLSSQQGIIASDSDSLFHPVNSNPSPQPYSLPNIPIHQQNNAYIQSFSHIPINRDHLSRPPPLFHSNPVSSYNNPNFIPPPLPSSFQTPIQRHQIPSNVFPQHNQNQQFVPNQLNQNQQFIPHPSNNQLPIQYVYYVPSASATSPSPSSHSKTLPSVTHIPVLTSKLDFFAWDESVTSLLRAHGLLGHILDPTEPLDPMRPDRVPRPLPILPATPTSKDLAELTAWWDDDNAAQHVLTSQIGSIPRGLLPSPNLVARTALSIYQTLVRYYGTCSFADCAELLNNINNCYCQPGRVQEYVSKWRYTVHGQGQARLARGPTLARP
jgi:hypothetical protein